MSADTDLEHAAAYPFDVPSHSYLFSPQHGTPGPFDYGMIRGKALTPVAAVGSNASPAQLRRKFPAGGSVTDDIPVLLTEFQDFDTVFAARVSRYGSIPATPCPSPGTSIRLHVTFLNARQLERMNATESLGVGYDLVEMPDGCVPELAGRQVLTYVARSGALLVDGQPSALERTPSTNRVFAEISEREAIEIVAGIVGLSAAELVTSVKGDRDLHARLNNELATSGVGDGQHRRHMGAGGVQDPH
ncbi:hypothetical protein [Mycobacterium sp. OTB74]|jgi:hypothetical protein|uniref:hypothetical protein n=1 Tax=Mycobacterium sp. OTB74 TaxID=1853452 RepID=UPI002475C5E3|nr:hypothetical protein [Mycobacterium sp. OTB74]